MRCGIRTAQLRELRAPGNYFDAGFRPLMGCVRRHAKLNFASSQDELLAALAGQRTNAPIQLPDFESLWAACATATTG